jgi:TP901 family phage tail tape measure protein
VASKVIANLIALIGADTSGFEAGLNMVQGGLGGVIKGLGSVALAGALAFGSGQVIGQAAEFESTLKNIQSISGMTGTEINKLGQDLLAIGADSVAGPQAVAAAYNDIVGGVADASTHMAILNSSIAMAEAGQADLGASTNGLISVMNSYGYTAAEAATVSDVFTQTVGKGVGSMDEFVAAMSPISGLAASNGVEFDRLGAMMAWMTTKGTSAAQSATQIKAAMIAIQKPNDAMKKGLEAIGAESAEMALKTWGLEGTLGRLEQAFDGNSTMMAEALGSTEALQAAVAINDKGYEEFLGTFQDTMGGVTSAARAVQLEAFSAQWSKFQNTLGAVATGIGLAVLPALTTLVGGVNQFMQDVQKEGLGAALQKWFNAGIDWLKNEAPGIFQGALAAAVALGTTVLAWLQSNGPDIIGGLFLWFDGAIAWLRGQASAIFGGALKKAVDLGTDAYNWLATNAPNIADGVKNWITNALAWLRDTAPGLVRSALSTMFAAAGSGNENSVSEAVRDKVGDGAGLLAGLGDLGAAFNKWLDVGLTWIADNVPGLVADALKTGFQFVADVGAWLMENGPDVARGVGSWLGTALRTAAVQGAALVGGFFREIFGAGTQEDLSAGVDGGMLGLEQAASNAPGILGTIADAITNILGGALNTIAGLVEGLFGLKEGSLSAGVTEVFKEGGPFHTAVKLGASFLQLIIDKAIEVGKKLIGSLLSPFKTLLQAISIVAHYAGNAELAGSAANAVTTIDEWQSGQGNANGGMDISGWSMVGERGPEPAYFGNGGGRVIRSSRAQSMMGGNATVNITVNNQTDGYTLVEQMRRELKSRNVQIEGLTT